MWYAVNVKPFLLFGIVEFCGRNVITKNIPVQAIHMELIFKLFRKQGGAHKSPIMEQIWIVIFSVSHNIVKGLFKKNKVRNLKVSKQKKNY